MDTSHYNAALCNIPAPGGGGCHADLLGVAEASLSGNGTTDTTRSTTRSGEYQLPRGAKPVLTEPCIMFQFNRNTWTYTAIFYSAETDTETSRLREIADVMLQALRDREAEHLEKLKP